jgi:flagellar basal-body rod protein FlgF
MDRIIYTSMTGANAAAHRQAVLSNNLANASTQRLSAPRCPPSARCRCRATAPAPACSRWKPPRATATPPGPARTGRSLDAMAMGNAWFAVQGLDGTEAYTRAGSFEVSATGQLLTSTGLPVLSDGGAPIDIPPGAEVSLGSRRHRHGTHRRAGAAGRGAPQAGHPHAGRPAQARRRRAVPSHVRRAHAQRCQRPHAQRHAGRLQRQPVECMVGMIAASRQFEQQMRLLQTAETNDKTASQLLGMNG